MGRTQQTHEPERDTGCLPTMYQPLARVLHIQSNGRRANKIHLGSRRNGELSEELASDVASIRDIFTDIIADGK